MKTPAPNEWADVAPGEKRWISQAFTTRGGRTFEVTVGVLRGMDDGPVFANIAGQHGMEHAGPIALREVFDEIDPSKMRGTLLLCPCANPLALELNSEVYPEREEALLPAPGEADLDASKFNWHKREDLGDDNMNRMWGDDLADSGGGGYVGEVVRWLWRVAVGPADFVIDHHCVKDCDKAYVFVEDPSIAWTPLLDVQGVWCTGPLQPEPTAYPYRRLCMQASRRGKVGICVEYSAQKIIRESDRTVGHHLVRNVMRGLDMLEGEAQISAPVWLIPGPYWEHIESLESKHVGHIHWCVHDDYQLVKKGEPICHIHCVQTNRRLQTIAAPADGLFMHRNPRALVRPGMTVARFTREAQLLAEPGRPAGCQPAAIE